METIEKNKVTNQTNKAKSSSKDSSIIKLEESIATLQQQLVEATKATNKDNTTINELKAKIEKLEKGNEQKENVKKDSNVKSNTAISFSTDGNILTRSITIHIALSKSLYAARNITQVNFTSKPLTATVTAINKMVRARNIDKYVMPSVINTSPHDVGWSKAVRDYWEGFMLYVLATGKRLDTSLDFTSTEGMRLYKAEYSKITKKYTDNTARMPDKEGEFSKDRYNALFELENKIIGLDSNGNRIATPVNPVDYTTWLFATMNSLVANRVVDVDNSNNIKFYLESPNEIKEVEDRRFNLVRSAEKEYYAIEDDMKTLTNLLYVFATGGNISSMDKNDKRKAVRKYVDLYPDKFLAIIKDTNLQTRAYIEQLINYGILKRLTGTSIIVDAVDTSVKVGNSIEEAIAFISNPTSSQKANVNSFEMRFKGLTK